LGYCEIKDLILREQYYIDIFTPPYNILETAGSRLRKTHNKESLVKMSISKLGLNNPMYGVNHSEIIKVTISKKGIPYL
jgi:group I intron endonuclease